MRRRAAPMALVLLALQACAGPEPREDSPSATPAGVAVTPAEPAAHEPAPARGWVEPEQLARHRARCVEVQDAHACLTTLARHAPDLCHALAVSERDARLRARLGAALDEAGGTTCYARSEAARIEPRVTGAWALLDAGDAPEPAEAGDDPLLRWELLLAQRSRALERPPGDAEPERAPTAIAGRAPALAQETRAAYLAVRERLRRGESATAAHREAVDLAAGARDLTALLQLDAVRPLLAPADAGSHLAIAELALQRGLPLVALHHALTASREGGPSAAPARVVVARAHLMAGSVEPALDVALRGAEDAAAHGTVKVEALCALGEVLVAKDQAATALDAFTRAEREAQAQGDASAARRMSLNRAIAYLRAGDATGARAALGTWSDSPELDRRRDVLLALADLTAGACAPRDAADRIAAALATARASGALGVVESYAGLVERLRGRRAD